MRVVTVRRMHAHEGALVLEAARASKPRAAALEEAVGSHPDRVRVLHLGHEHAGAFVLTDLAGGVEEISGFALTPVGMSAGAERAVVEYLVNAAKFGGKRAIEVLAPVDSAEGRHLAREGFRPMGAAAEGLQRFRIDLKPPRPAPKVEGSANPPKRPKKA